jgi:serine protease Do
MQFKRLAPPLAAVALAVAALAGFGQHPPAFAVTPPASGPAAPAAVGLPDFTGLVAAAAPAVVSVSVTRMQPVAAGPTDGLDPADPRFEFFRRFGPPSADGDGPLQRGGGSGFIVSSDGRVLTNAHVVANAQEVKVQLADKREFVARIVGIDEPSDVAVLKIDARNLPALEVGDPAGLKVGEWVIAIGSPFGLENTVSAGVVSAKSRNLPNGGFVPFIQTDVAINPGNSGGPLLNLAGEVVGINSQIYSQSGGYMGLSFAIPIDLAMEVETQLVAHGKVPRGRLGVAVQSLDQGLAQSFGLDAPRGALVSRVEAGTPAAQAGLVPGDVILTLDGESVEDSAALARLVAGKRPGERVVLELRREGRARRLELALGEQAASLAAGGNERSMTGRLGLAVRDVPPRAGGGAVVTDVSGPAARAGVRAGDVILAVGSARVADAEELARLVEAAKGRVALLVKRDDVEIFVPVELG